MSSRIDCSVRADPERLHTELCIGQSVRAYSRGERRSQRREEPEGSRITAQSNTCEEENGLQPFLVLVVVLLLRLRDPILSFDPLRVGIELLGNLRDIFGFPPRDLDKRAGA